MSSSPITCAAATSAQRSWRCSSTIHRCATSVTSKDDARHSNQTAAIVIAAGGGALVITGIVLLVTASSSRSTGELTKPRVYPLLGNGTTGLGLSAAF